MAELTIKDVIMGMPGAFLPEKAAGLNAKIQFRISGEGGGDWYIEIKDQKLTPHEGIVSGANLTLSASAADAVDILTGKLDGMTAYMRGKLQASGDLGLAMRFPAMFKRL